MSIPDQMNLIITLPRFIIDLKIWDDSMNDSILVYTVLDCLLIFFYSFPIKLMHKKYRPTTLSRFIGVVFVVYKPGGLCAI